MPNRQLPPNPPGCRSLTDPEVSRLRSQHSKLWANPNKTCETCTKEEKGGVATFRIWEGTEAVTCDCACVEQWKLHRWLLNSGVDKRYQRFSWDDTVQVNGAAQAAVLEYAQDAVAMISQGEGLTLWSKDRGTGKTLLGTLLLKGLLAKGYDGHFTQFNEMLDQFTAGWRSEEERSWFIRRVRNVEVLVVDDMGRESKGRENITEAMFDTVIRARVAACKPTFITTNYTPDEMRQGYGNNVLSLLTEVNDFIEVPGSDYRPIIKAQRIRDRADGIVHPIVAL
jgi:DNA replication protein DnaC